MSETETSEIHSNTKSEETSNIPQTGDLQSIQAAYRLNGKNYLKWSQFVQTFLKGKGKISHLLGTGPKKGDPKFAAWDEEDSMVMSWLWNSMLPEISDTCMFLPTAQDIWTTIRQTYSKAGDAALIYEIKTKISATKQGNLSVTQYANLLQNLWQELDQYRCVQMLCSEDAATLKNFIEKDRVYDFLAGLNVEFDQVRVQILGKERLSSLNETISLIRAEENRREVMLEPKTLEGSAMISTKSNKDTIWCTYCKKSRHTRDDCFKLHGKEQVLSRKGGFKGGKAHLTAGEDQTQEKSNQAGMGEFKKEEIEKLRNLLNSLEKSSSTCSLAQSGKYLNSYALSASSMSSLGSWVIDSGATDHMTHSPIRFRTYNPCPGNRKITVADGSPITVAGQGTVNLSNSLSLNNVLHVPKLSSNLISIHQITKDLNCRVIFYSTHCVFQDLVTGRTIGLAKVNDGLYYLEEMSGNKKNKNQLSLTCSSNNKSEIWLHHFRLGHPSFILLKSMFPSLFKNEDVSSFHCDTCEIAKHHRLSFPLSNTRSTRPFSLIHTDIWGPCRISSISGAKWFVTFIDDCTRTTWLFLMKEKSEVSSIFPMFHKMICTQFGSLIKRVRSDNARDYFNQILSSFFQKEGIIHESSCVDTPQQNGIAERKNRHLLNVTRAILFQHKVPKTFWGEAVLTAAHLINRVPSKVLNNQSPIAALSVFYPDFNVSCTLSPKVFGCVAFVHVHAHQRGKLDPRALKCIFVGYSNTKKGYKCYHPPSKKFFTSMDVTFVENEPYSQSNNPHLQGESSWEDKEFLLDLQSPTLNLKSFKPDHTPNSKGEHTSSEPEPEFEVEHASKEIEPDLGAEGKSGLNPTTPLKVYSRKKVHISEPVQIQESEPQSGTENSVPLCVQSDSAPCEFNDLDLPIAVRKGTRECTKHPISNFVSFHRLSPQHKTFLTTINSISIPQTLQEALRNKNWLHAMKEEMNALERNKTWEIVNLPKGKKTVGCKWVFTLKYRADGSLERHKARLVAKGYTQTYGIDYQETFAPVAKMNTVRVLLSLAANFGWCLQQFDVKNAFLHGDLEEEVYMEPPPGFNEMFFEKKVCRLKKALYGLKQSPRAWFGRFTKVMLAMQYKQSQGDHTLFIKHSKGGVTALLVYVDDIIITGNDPIERETLKKCLAKEFEIKELGRLKYFLGIEVAYSSKGIFVSQQKYVLDLLKETGNLGCKAASTPIEPNLRLNEEKDDSTVDKGRYQRLVGKLIYLSHTRPDIAFAVSVVSQFMHDPREKHLQAVNRILSYLKGTPGRGILFKKNEGLLIEAYTDADYAGSVVDRRSTSGYCTFLGGNLVTWRSKKQSVVARSSAEAEFRAMAHGVCELLWLKIILDDLKIKWEGPMKLYCDNKSAINIAHNPVQHDRTKHIEVDRHFIKEKLDSGMICTPYVASNNQLADVLTKGMPTSNFEDITCKMGMENIYSPS